MPDLMIKRWGRYHSWRNSASGRLTQSLLAISEGFKPFLAKVSLLGDYWRSLGAVFSQQIETD